MESPLVGSKEIGNAEILDELTTNRGELKVRTVSFGEERNDQVITILEECYNTLSPRYYSLKLRGSTLNKI